MRFRHPDHGSRWRQTTVEPPAPTGGKYLDNVEPATGKTYSQVADSDARDRVIRHMRSQASLPATPKTAVDLFWDIAKALDTAENARTIVSILLHKGSITSQPQLRVSLGKLRRAGILRAQPESQRREHVVTEQYQHPLRMLRLRGAYPHLTTRHRTYAPSQSA